MMFPAQAAAAIVARRKTSAAPRQDSAKPRGGPSLFRGLKHLCQRFGPEFRPWKGEAYLFALAILSALVMRLAYPRIDLVIVSAVGLVPFLWALSRATSGKQAFYLGWVFGAIYYYVQLFWLHILTQYNVMIPPALIALGIYLGLFKAMFAWIVWVAGARSRSSFLVAAAAWVSFEYLQSLGDMGFPWGYLGHMLWLHPRLIQLAAWTGVYGLSLVLFWVNHLVADGIRFVRREAGAPPVWLLAIRLGVLGLFGGVIWLAAGDADRRVEADDFYATAPATVGIVQPNIPQRMKLDSYSFDQPAERRMKLQTDILLKTIHLSDALQNAPADERCDLIVWPETAVTDTYFSLRPPYRTLFKDLATTRLRASIFFGADQLRVFRAGRFVGADRLDADDYERHPEAYRVVSHVSGWLAEPGSGINPRVYNKRQLVPFAEGIPFVQHIKPLADFIATVSQMVPYTPGKEPLVFDLKRRDGKATLLRFGPLICYESCYPRLARALVRKGAEMLIIITNDAWYEQTAGPRQHQLEAVFRAVETHRWVVRCGNHGISCFISPRGEIVEETRLAQDATLKRRIRGVKALTFYSRFGDLFSRFMLLATAGLLAVERLRR